MRAAEDGAAGAVAHPSTRPDLRADCARCAALCCVGPAFGRSADFAVDKPAGRPCPNLRADHRCGIHDTLRERGFSGCVAYDCFGAGQRVTEVVLGGRDRRAGPAAFAALDGLRVLHELVWYLSEALTVVADRALRTELAAALVAVEQRAAADAAGLAAVDPAAHRAAVAPLLRAVSHHRRAALRPEPPAHRGADLAGARLRRADLRAADLGGALLLGADLRDADLRDADLLGADLRGARLRGADLTGALFLVGSQLAGARGDPTTVLPPTVTRPAAWR